MRYINESQYQDWLQAYMVARVKDPHQLFAELQGISRTDAKELCYQVMFSSPFLKNHLTN